ncbi:hypothetical protein DL546_005592 [Coniochaeta pulveracea]|nr:hypothetical protein DL546_005592 [Coniochaeta pulveracea]
MCDMTQTFGMAVPRVAATNEAYRAALLELPSAYLESEDTGVSGRDVGSRSALSPALMAMGDEEGVLPDLQGRALTTMSLLVCAFIRNMPLAWQQQPSEAVEHLVGYLEGHAADGGVMAALYWLFVRLYLSTALAKATSLSIRLPSTDLFTSLEPAAGIAQRTSSHAYRALLLCARTLAFCFPHEGANSTAPDGTPSVPVVETWRTLINELDAWQTSRPGNFEPMVDMDAPAASASYPFPTIFFTTGAAVLANQLYHTAMLLLLSHKPRSWRMAYPLPTSMAAGSLTQSPLWHAQQVCGIALNNDRKDCWDPCLVASLLVAARGMTHEEQQTAVMHGLSRIAEITRWKLDAVVAELKEEWDIAEAV